MWGGGSWCVVGRGIEQNRKKENLMDTNNSVVMGGGERGYGGINDDRDLTWGGEYTIWCRNNVL